MDIKEKYQAFNPSPSPYVVCEETPVECHTDHILEDFENASPYFCTFHANRICD